MPSIVWWICPNCSKRFYSHYELKDRECDLFCPWCKKYFNNKKQGKIVVSEFADLPADAIDDTSGHGMG